MAMERGSGKPIAISAPRVRHFDCRKGSCKPLAGSDCLIARYHEPCPGLATINVEPVHTKYDESTAAKAAAGDRRAFERLYHANVNRVYSLCARMVADRGRAEELTQDVFVRAWEKLHLFKGESAFFDLVASVGNQRSAERQKDRRTARRTVGRT